MLSNILPRGLPVPLRRFGLAGLLCGLLVFGGGAVPSSSAATGGGPHSKARERRAQAVAIGQRRLPIGTKRAKKPKGKHAGAGKPGGSPAAGGVPAVPAPVVPPPPPPPPLLEAGFENGLLGWNTSGVGEVVPTVVTDTAREGTHSARVILTGSQARSELVLGGNGSGSSTGAIELAEGADYWYGFSFVIKQMVWGHPGAHDLVMQFKSESDGPPAVALDFWSWAGVQGLWTEGAAMGGNRPLAPLSENAWYDVAMHLHASSRGAGSYEVFLNGKLLDARQGVNTIVPGASFAYIKTGLYRNTQEITGTSELRIDSARLGTSLAAVSPR